MRIAFFEIQDWEKAELARILSAHELSFFDRALEATDLPSLQDCEILSVFIHSHVTQEIIAGLPALKLIATRSTGYDHIDIAAAQRRSLIVCNVPSYGDNTVAEHAFALILALSRNVHKSHVRRLRNDFSIEGLKGFDLKGKTIGIIGTGKIGRHAIKIARGFDMRVIAYDLFPNEKLAAEFGFEYLPLEKILGESDILSLHTPYTKETHHLINEDNIKMVKPGALLINTARGELVDNDALIWALDQKILAGCGLDVIEGEELIQEEKELLYDSTNTKMAELVKNHILLGRDNVVYTPHIAFYSQEALERILATTIENIECFTKGSCPNAIPLAYPRA